jgi:hypothetical protein
VALFDQDQKHKEQSRYLRRLLLLLMAALCVLGLIPYDVTRESPCTPQGILA